MNIKLLTVAAKTPAWLHPVCFNPLMRYHLAKLDFNMNWLLKWPKELEQQLRTVSGYDLAVCGHYSEGEVRLCGVSRLFFKDSFIKGHRTFCVHRAALMISWNNPYNWYVKYRAYKAIIKARVKQDIFVTPIWKHVLAGFLYGGLSMYALGSIL